MNIDRRGLLKRRVTRIGSVGRLRLSRRHALQVSLAVSGLALVGCSSGLLSGGADESLIAWPAEDRWPELFHQSSPRVRETYRFAVANQDALRWMPCFCGCRATGHTSNASCYVQEMRGDGSVLLDSMSFG
jgi:hypothetical protein